MEGSSTSMLWSQDEIETREDGFLIIRDGGGIEEEQPLLLHSTESMLLLLYPSMSKQAILSTCGHFGDVEPMLKSEESKEEEEDDDNKDVVTDDSKEATPTDQGNDDDTDDDGDDDNDDSLVHDPMEVEEHGEENFEDTDNMDEDMNISDDEEMHDNNNDDDDNDDEPDKAMTENENSLKNGESKIPPEYEIYQRLERCHNVAAKAQSALLDIRHSRHRKKRDQTRERLSRDEVKVRALEAKQQRLLSQRSETSGEGSVPTEDENDNGEGGDAMNSDDEREVEDVRESQSIRVARTINSVRALYPHLLPMLNHPRRNDRKLIIKDVKWKSKKRTMCWILGINVMDTTTCKLWMNVFDDAKIILQGFIPVPRALEVSKDPLGSPDYWAQNWIEDVILRSQPQIISPLSILEEFGYLSSDGIREVALRCDKDLCMHVGGETKVNVQKRYDHAVEKLHRRLSNLLTRRFTGARVSIYGSCLSNLSLGEGADVDLSLWIPEADKLQTDFHKGAISAGKYEKDMKRLVYQVFHKLKNLEHEFHNMQAITRARVPVVKGTYNFAENPYSNDGSLNFDICFLNDIAVANSGLLRQYSLVDSRVRSLMMTVKQWAKEYKLNSAKDNYISSYAWINLVIFYLQCLGFVPNLQSRQLMADVNVEPNPEGNYWHNVNELDTCTLTWEEVNRANVWSFPAEYENLPVSALLYGFFEFYSCRFPSATFAVSIKEGSIKLLKSNQRKVNLFFCIEDPFETFDSHTPHDLGTPAGEKGARDIIKFIHEAEMHLRDLLCGVMESFSLWPEAPFLEPQPAGKNAKNAKFTRFQQKLDDGRNTASPVSTRRGGGRQRGGKGNKNQQPNEGGGDGIGNARGPANRRKGGGRNTPVAGDKPADNSRESTQSPGQPTGQQHPKKGNPNNRTNRNRRRAKQNQNNNQQDGEHGNKNGPSKRGPQRPKRGGRGKKPPAENNSHTVT